MRYLIPIIILFSSCSTIHRLTTHTKTDTTIGHHYDSTNVAKVVDSSQYLDIDSASITVDLDTNYNRPVDTFSKKEVQIIHDVVKAVAGNQKVKSVTIKLTGLKKTDTHITTTDSIKVVKSDTAHIATNKTVVDLKRTSYLNLILVGAGLLILAIVVLYIKGKLSFITKLIPILIISLMIGKMCVSCKEDKPMSAYGVRNKNKDGINNLCRLCASRRSTASFNKDVCKKWKSQNPEYFKNWYKNRIKTNSIFHLTINTRSRISNGLRSIGSRKNCKTIEYLGCTFPFLKKHLENQFQSGMTWENYGPAWHVDHIKPLATFDLSNQVEQSIAFNYKNLQPLFAMDNWKKNKRLYSTI